MDNVGTVDGIVVDTDYRVRVGHRVGADQRFARLPDQLRRADPVRW